MVKYTNKDAWLSSDFSCSTTTQIIYLGSSSLGTLYLPNTSDINVQNNVGIGYTLYLVDTVGTTSSFTISPASGYINGQSTYNIDNPAYTTTLITYIDSDQWSIINTSNITSGGGMGPQGDQGPQGPTGTAGVDGTQGPTGPAGTTGAQGPTGSGRYTISSIAPAGPTSGDRWYDLSTGNEYVYIDDGNSVQWVAPASVGPQGPQGFQGQSGPIGPTGPIGATVGTISLTLNGNGANITLGSKGYVTVPYDATILQWSLVSTATGSIVIDVKKCSYATFPNTTPIDGTDPPTLTNQIKNLSTGFTGWSPNISANDVLEFSVDSNSGIQYINLNLKLAKSV